MDRTAILAARERVRMSDLVGQYTKLYRTGRAFKGLCPFHRERTPSFHVRDDTGRAKCFGCDWHGDVIDFVMQIRGVDFLAAIDILTDGERSAYSRSRDEVAQDLREDERRRVAHAHGLWLKRLPVAGTLAERYLRETRAIGGNLPDMLGYLPEVWCSDLGEASPALLAPLQDENGHVSAVQITFLCSETLDAWRDGGGRRIKRTMGLMRKGAVRFGLPMPLMGIAGSVEDAMAARQMFSIPVWAACGEARMPHLWLPEEIEQLVVFADGDEAGLRAADACMAAYGRRMAVEIAPPTGSKDWSEFLMRRGA